MISRVIAKLVETGIRRGKILEEDEEIYKYGYQLMLEKVSVVIISILIAVIFKAFWEIFIFYIIFIPLRSYAGGYHARSTGMCMILSTAMIIIYIILSKALNVLPGGQYLCFAEILILPAMFKLAPVENANKPLSKNEKRQYGRTVKKIYIVQMVGIIFSWIFGWNNVAIDITVLHGILLCSMAVGAYLMSEYGMLQV